MIVFAPGVAGSRPKKANLGCLKLYYAINNMEKILLSPELEPYFPEMIQIVTDRAQKKTEKLLTVGGDHSISFHAISSLCKHYDGINCLIFDAHHDANDDNYLTHYTYLSRLKKNYNIAARCIGVRADEDEAIVPYNDNFVPFWPIYISVDVDFFPEVKSVGYHEGIDSRYGLQYFINEVKKYESYSCVGADLVEWYGSNAIREERFVGTILEQVWNRMIQE